MPSFILRSDKMLDLTLVNSRYFDVTLPGGINLKVEPCKLKTLRKFQNMAKRVKTDDDMVDIIKEILNKNRANYTVTDEMVGELTFDQMNVLLTDYFNWIAKEKLDNPN